MDKLIDALRALAGFILGFITAHQYGHGREMQKAAAAHRAVADAGRDDTADRLRRLERRKRVRGVPPTQR